MRVGAAGNQPDTSFLRERRFQSILLSVVPSLRDNASELQTLTTYF